MKKPNILVILTDQQSYKMVSRRCDNNLKTPGIDYLEKNGVSFDRTYCTNPVCLPSRFSFVTSKYPSYINVRDNHYKDTTTGIKDHIYAEGVGKIFKQNGYDAVYGGKEHFPGFSAAELGFDIITNDSRETLLHECCEFLKKDRDKPFLMFASFVNPHDICLKAISDFAYTEKEKRVVSVLPKAMEILKGYMQEFNKMDESEKKSLIDSIKLPDNYEVQKGEAQAIADMLEQDGFRMRARENYSDADWKIHRWLYIKLTELVDLHIDTLLKTLRDTGKEDNTVVIFTSDHGDMDSSHRMEHKTVLYEESVKVPFIISYKGMKNAGAVDNKHLISNGLDLLPTIYDYAGIEPQKSLEGSSVKLLAEGIENTPWRKYLKVESKIGDMITDGRYKLVKYFGGKDSLQFYDIMKQPLEMENLLTNEEYSQKVQEFSDVYSEYLKQGYLG
ncbi:MAG: Arylsulfatase [Firmicutes bacterium ADurb.Bin193]|nr:MAG: Arylsulfatase [Firmicutes bacterium ADurb.Bin193]